MYYTHDTDEMTESQAARFRLWFEKEIGTEIESTEHDIDAITFCCFDVTVNDMKKIFEFEAHNVNRLSESSFIKYWEGYYAGVPMESASASEYYDHHPKKQITVEGKRWKSCPLCYGGNCLADGVWGTGEKLSNGYIPADGELIKNHHSKCEDCGWEQWS